MWQIRYAYGVVWEPINLSFFQSAMEWIWLQTDCTTAMTYEPKIHPNALVLVPPQIELGLGSWSTAVSCFVSSSSDWHSFKQKVGTESGKALIQLDSMVMLISVINNDSVFSQLMVHIVHISLYIYIRYTYFIYSHLQVPSPVSAFAAQNVGAVWRRLRLRTPGGTPGPGNVRYVFRFVFH